MGIRILSSFTWAYCGKMSMQSVPIFEIHMPLVTPGSHISGKVRAM